MRTLDRAFVRTARRYPLRFMMADGKTPRVRFFSALTKTIYIARRLRPTIGEQQMIGLLLPPSVGGALTNYALTLLGRVPVNLNYTASSEVIASCAKQCDVEVVITSKAFVERFPKLEIPGRTVFLEDVLQSPRTGEKLLALLLASTMPQTLLRKAIGAVPGKRSVDDLATVIFSSGSTGDPKGVMLTHYNIASNIQQVSQVFMLDGTRQDSRHPALLPLLRLHGRAVDAGRQRCRRRLSSQSARHQGNRRTGRAVSRHFPHRHADISAGLHAPLLA